MFSPPKICNSSLREWRHRANSWFRSQGAPDWKGSQHNGMYLLPSDVVNSFRHLIFLQRRKRRHRASRLWLEHAWRNCFLRRRLRGWVSWNGTIVVRVVDCYPRFILRCSDYFAGTRRALLSFQISKNLWAATFWEQTHKKSNASLENCHWDCHAESRRHRMQQERAADKLS